MKISDLKPGMNNADVKAEVAEMEEPREVMTKFGTAAQLTNVTLKDDSGKIRLTLWGDLPEGLKVGSKLEIKGAFVKDFRGEPQLGVPRRGEVKVVE